MEKKSINSKPAKTLAFHLNFVLEAYLIKFDYVDSEEVSFKGHVCDFSVDYDAIDKSNILNIHKYLMIKNNI